VTNQTMTGAGQPREAVAETNHETNSTLPNKKGFWEILRDVILGVSACIVAVVEALQAICSLEIVEICALRVAAG
jgi:hypothetical protein